jgi:hypothetical protein
MTDRFLKVKLKSVSQSELIATDQVEETDFYKGQLLNVETPAQSSGQLTERERERRKWDIVRIAHERMRCQFGS